MPLRHGWSFARSTDMKLPNFIIIGAPKCGTTSLASYLGKHPEVYFSPWKEVNYFALAGRQLPEKGPASAEVLQAMLYSYCITDFEVYRSLFNGVTDQKAVGEASVRYLYYQEAAPRIRETLPDVRMVAILREPVSRLYSHYCMMKQFQLEPLELMEAIAAEPARIADHWGWDWHYAAVGRYAEQLKRYYNLFDRNQLKVILYDDFVAKPRDVYREICEHIGIDGSIVPDMSGRGKVAYRPKNLTVDRWLQWPNPTRERIRMLLPREVYRKGIYLIRKLNRARVPKLDAASREELARLFVDDNRQLEELLGRKIPWNGLIRNA